jgi:hypothetical protein
LPDRPQTSGAGRSLDQLGETLLRDQVDAPSIEA